MVYAYFFEKEKGWKGIDTIKDWKILYIGANHQEKGEILGEFDDILIKRVKKTYTTSSYIIDCSLYDEVIRSLDYPKEIDMFYIEILQNMYICLGLYPNLVYQYPSFSDIVGTNVVRKFGEC